MNSSLTTCISLFLVLLTSVTSAEEKGTLVIVGGGTIPQEIREEFFNLAGGKGKANIVMIPTASRAADDPTKAESFLEDWSEMEPATLQLLHTRDRKLADDPAFVKPLREATGVWIGGGQQTRVIEAYRGTLVEQELHRLLKRGGVIGGTSAGAAVMSELMIQGGKEVARSGPGFGFLKGTVIDQHFVARKRITRLRGVLAEHPEQAGLGIDESTSVTIRGTTLTVMGTSTVTAIDAKNSNHPSRERELKSGDRLDLTTLHRKRTEAIEKSDPR